MEDDHVDRRRVDVQQCMKLSLTNSPIGLIVLIDHAHLTKSDEPSLSVFTLSHPGDDLRSPGDATLQTARQTIGDALTRCTGAIGKPLHELAAIMPIQDGRPSHRMMRPVRSVRTDQVLGKRQDERTDVFTKKQANACQLLKHCP